MSCTLGTSRQTRIRTLIQAIPRDRQTMMFSAMLSRRFRARRCHVSQEDAQCHDLFLCAMTVRSSNCPPQLLPSTNRFKPFVGPIIHPHTVVGFCVPNSVATRSPSGATWPREVRNLAHEYLRRPAGGAQTWRVCGHTR